jgi:3-deoxy-D-manno-octulosonic acid kinase
VASVHDGTTLVAAADAAAEAGRILGAHGSLAGWAAADASTRVLRGRGAAFHVRSPVGNEWVVRHYRRGGAVAGLLGDRYLRLGAPRPLAELCASDAARVRGLRTPRIIAAAWRSSGAFYSADLATAFVPDSVDLADATFGGGGDVAVVDAWHAAGQLLRATFAAAVRHPDLNLRNILLSTASGRVEAWLLDLDRARVARDRSPSAERRMLARLHRSRRKFEALHGRAVDDAALAAFEAAAAGRR